MKKMLFPYTAIIATLLYLAELILIFIKRPDLITIYFSSARGLLFLLMAALSLFFYVTSKNSPAWIQNRGMFLKILLQTLSTFLILYFPLAYFDATSSGWFAGLGAIILAVVGIPLFIMLSVIAYFIQKNQGELTGRIKFLNFAQIILCLAMLIFFGLGITHELNPLQRWQSYQLDKEVNLK